MSVLLFCGFGERRRNLWCSSIRSKSLFNALNGYFLYTGFNKVENLLSVLHDINQLIFGIVGVLMIVVGEQDQLIINSILDYRCTDDCCREYQD